MSGRRGGLVPVQRHESHRNRAVYTHLIVLDVYPNKSMRCGHRAGYAFDGARPRSDPDCAVSRFSGSDAEHVPDEVLGRCGAPGMDWCAPSPALAEGLEAVVQEHTPPPQQLGQPLSSAGCRDGVVHDVTEERLGQHDLTLDIPVDPIDALGMLDDLGHVVATVLAADPRPDDEPGWICDYVDDAGPTVLWGQPRHDRDRTSGPRHRRPAFPFHDVIDVTPAIPGPRSPRTRDEPGPRVHGPRLPMPCFPASQPSRRTRRGPGPTGR